MVLNNALRVFITLQGSSSLCRTVNSVVKEQSNAEIAAACWRSLGWRRCGGVFCLMHLGSWSGLMEPTPVLSVLSLCQRNEQPCVDAHWSSQGWGLPWIHSSNQIDVDARLWFLPACRRICSDNKLVLPLFLLPLPLVTGAVQLLAAVCDAEGQFCSCCSISAAQLFV